LLKAIRLTDKKLNPERIINPFEIIPIDFADFITLFLDEKAKVKTLPLKKLGKCQF
jgi:hypothetical protein